MKTVQADIFPTRAMQILDHLEARSVCCGQTLHKILPTSVYQQKSFQQRRFGHLPVDARMLLPFGLIISSWYGVDELAEVRIAEVCDAVPRRMNIAQRRLRRLDNAVLCTLDRVI